MDAPTIPVQIAVGDYAQVTHIEPGTNGRPDNVVVATFTVKSINPQNVVTGSTVLGPLDTDKGWRVELLTKAPENLLLPETVAEIAAWTRNGEVLHLIGKKDVWRDADSGQLAETDMIHGWRGWDGFAAEAAAYRSYLDGLAAEPVLGVDGAAQVEGTLDV